MIEETESSQNELAEKLGMDSGTLSRYMTGKTIKFSAENIIEMAKIFDTSTDFLLGLTDIPYKTNYDLENMGFTVDAAKKLLDTTPMSVGEIAEELGFSYPNHFTRLFKSKTGQSPQQYRKSKS